jgi:hypothetical protein
MRVFTFILIITISGGLLIGPAFGDPYIDRVVEVNFGSPRDTDFSDPSTVQGAPEAWGDEGLGGSMDVINIGTGGSITVEFVDNVIFNGPGVDFVIFENSFYVGGDFSKLFLEPAYVYVSSDGDNYTSFPVNYTPPDPALPGGDDNPDNYINFAGIRPVFSNTQNGIDPLDPSVSGGDPFDLSDIIEEAEKRGIDLQNIRFIKIQDMIRRIDVDKDGDIIPGSTYPLVNGFDLDAIAAINSKPPGEKTATGDSWIYYE